MEESGGPEDGLPVPQRYWAVLAIALAITMAVLDGAIANVALPTIARDLGIAPADAIWIVNAYQLAVVVSLLPLASLGEIVGYARVYLGGLVLFTVASLACALSDSLVTLTLARILQGFGGAGIMAINGALVRYTYPHRLLGRGIGLNAFVVAVSSALGPTVASAILAVGSWPWLFAINLPIGLVTLAIAYRSLPQSETIARRFDILSALLNALAFGLTISGADLLARSDRVGLGAAVLCGGIAAGVLLARRELHRDWPLLPLDLLRIPIFALSVATSVCSFCAQMLAFVALPFYLEGIHHRSAVETGFLLTPWPIAVGIVAPISGHLADRFSAALLGGIGLVLLSVGLAALALLPADASGLNIAWRMALCGTGFGLFQAPNNRILLSSAPRPRSGAAGGMLATARLTGQTAGATLVALLLATMTVGGETMSLALGSGLALAGALASIARLGPSQPGSLEGSG